MKIKQLSILTCICAVSFSLQGAEVEVKQESPFGGLRIAEGIARATAKGLVEGLAEKAYFDWYMGGKHTAKDCSFDQPIYELLRVVEDELSPETSETKMSELIARFGVGSVFMLSAPLMQNALWFRYGREQVIRSMDQSIDDINVGYEKFGSRFYLAVLIGALYRFGARLAEMNFKTCKVTYSKNSLLMGAVEAGIPLIDFVAKIPGIADMSQKNKKRLSSVLKGLARSLSRQVHGTMV